MTTVHCELYSLRRVKNILTYLQPDIQITHTQASCLVYWEIW